MSAKRVVYEQARATLRTEQRGTDGRVKEHKRQRKQIHSRTEQQGTDGSGKGAQAAAVNRYSLSLSLCLSVCLSLCLSVSLSLSLSLSLSFFLSLCFCHHIFFLFGLTSFLMTNTLILHVSCVYFLSSCSLLCVSSYGVGTYIGHPTAQRSHVDCNQLHSRKMPASSDSTHDCLFAVLAWGLTPQQAGTHVPTSNCWANYF